MFGPGLLLRALEVLTVDFRGWVKGFAGSGMSKARKRFSQSNSSTEPCSQYVGKPCEGQANQAVVKLLMLIGFGPAFHLGWRFCSLSI